MADIDMPAARGCLYYLRLAIAEYRRSPNSALVSAWIGASNRLWHRSGLEGLEIRFSSD